MTNVAFRKLLVDALRAHQHGSLVADVILDCLIKMRGGSHEDFAEDPVGAILVSALSGIDPRKMLIKGALVLVKPTWVHSSWDIPVMTSTGLSPKKDWFVGTVMEVRSYVDPYPYRVHNDYIDKTTGVVQINDETYSTDRIRPWTNLR
jgi:hypothetical protein